MALVDMTCFDPNNSGGKHSHTGAPCLAELSSASLAMPSQAEEREALRERIFEAMTTFGHSVELTSQIQSGTFSDNYLVKLDGQVACMKVIGGMCGVTLGLAKDRLALDLDVLEATADHKILACPAYFGAIREAGGDNGKETVLAYFKEYVEGKTVAEAIYNGELKVPDVLAAVSEIFDQRIKLGFRVWDTNAEDFFLRADSEGLPLVERLVLVDPSTPLLSRDPEEGQEPLESLMAEFAEDLSNFVQYKGGSTAA